MCLIWTTNSPPLVRGHLCEPEAPAWCAPQRARVSVGAVAPTKQWLGTRKRIYGGDTEFYGEAIMFWSYNYLQVPDWGSPE
jgi:hypothetical protein